MSKLAECTKTRYFCCRIQADGLNFGASCMFYERVLAKEEKRGSYLLCMVYIKSVWWTTKCPEVQSIYKLKTRTHHDEITFILCHVHTKQPPILALLIKWEWNAIKLMHSEAKKEMRPESPGLEMCIWDDILNLPLHFKISRITIAATSNL